jgi:hypothetical protein
MRIDRINLSGSLSISSSLAVTPLRINDNYLFVSNTGNVGIGTNNPTSKLTVTGSIAVKGQLKATTLSGSFTGSIKLPTIPQGTSETNIVLVNGSGGLVYRSNLSLTGAQGSQGFQGTNGTIGVNGAQGATGAQGDTGAQGAQGANAGITSYTNPADNRVITSVSSTTINAEANLTFDGSILDINTTAAFKLPVGTTAERPASPTTGSMRYNTTTSALEIHLGGRWQIVSVSDYFVTVDYLVVAGGGSGGTLGGGGGGGFRQFTNQTLNKGQVYTVTVGTGQAGYSVANNVGKSGLDSSFNSHTSAGGGGGGGGATKNGVNGGSGGGAGFDVTGGTIGNGNTPSTSPSQGNNGGLGNGNAGGTQFAGGGGGGAGGVGADAPGIASGGNGGNGSTSDYAGSSTTYAAGGGGGAYLGGGTGTNGTGTTDVSGNGGKNGTNATNGSANRGGGGGGAGLNSSGNIQGANGTGGSGVVIIRSLIDITNPAHYPGGTRSIGGGYFIFTFNGDGSIKFS